MKKQQLKKETKGETKDVILVWSVLWCNVFIDWDMQKAGQLSYIIKMWVEAVKILEEDDKILLTKKTKWTKVSKN